MFAPRDAPYVWVTWITKLLAGEAQCQWAAWFRAHYAYDRLLRDFDLTKWTMDHNVLVHEQAQVLRMEGYHVLLEDQNAFKLRGQHGVTLAGKPDIVAWRDNDVYVVDCKTGMPRTSDQIQVLVYMLVLPHAQPLLWQGKTLWGRVQYQQDSVEIPPTALDASFRTQFRDTMAQVGGATERARVPSFAECRFCDIAHHYCPERIETPPQESVTEHDLF